VRPPKGSNITGEDNLRALLSCTDVGQAEQERRKKFEEMLDDIVSQGWNDSKIFHISQWQMERLLYYKI